MRMDSRIEQLLDKYWKADTSLEEEKELRDFFNSQDVPDDLKEVASLFNYFEFQKKQTLNEGDFKQNLKVSDDGRRGKVVKLMFTTAKIAAGVLVVVAATFLVRDEIRKSYPTEVVDTYSDPELAFEETKKALMMISRGFGKAKQGAGKIKIFNQAEEVIQHGPEKEDSSGETKI